VTPLLRFMELFPEFRASSWDGWRGILGRLTGQAREFWAVVGRGAGKSRIVALLACFFAAHDYKRAAGESIYVGVFGPDRKQAAITFRYILGLLRSVPSLARLIVNDTRESVWLSNGVVIEVITSTLAAPRGRAYALAIVEEAAFLPTDQSANPDVELLRSLRPALARVPGSLLAVVSSPYARKGELWRAYQRFHGQLDGEVVFVQADTLSLNPTFDRHAVERAYEDDPAAASAEYGAQFRQDLESYVSVEALQRVVVPGRAELSRQLDQVDYAAFCDPAGGSGEDSMTLAICHGEVEEETGRVIAVLDVLREAKPPFSPEAVVQEFAEMLRAYGLAEVTGDRYGGDWPQEAFWRAGIAYRKATRTKSEIYAACLARLNSRTVELLDVASLLSQLGALERRPHAGGQDTIDHPARGHDDLANASCGALTMIPAAAWTDERMLVTLG
jgi:hypothetical protein